jgi:hypothetical protein
VTRAHETAHPCPRGLSWPKRCPIQSPATCGWLAGLGLGTWLTFAFFYGQLAPPVSPGVALAVLAVGTVGIPTVVAALYRHVFLRHNLYGLINLSGVFGTTLNGYLVWVSAADPSDGWFVAPLIWALALTATLYRRTLRRHSLKDLSAGDQVSALGFWLLSFLGYAQSQHVSSLPGWQPAIAVFLCAAFFGWLTLLLCRTSMHFGHLIRTDLDGIMMARTRPLPGWAKRYAARVESTYSNPSTCFAVSTSLVSGVFLAPDGSALQTFVPYIVVAVALLVPLWPFARSRTRVLS